MIRRGLFLNLLLLIMMLLACTVAAQEQVLRSDSAPRASLPQAVRATIEALDDAATEATKDPTNGSYSIAVVDKSGVLWIKSFGLADIERKIPRYCQHGVPGLLDHETVHGSDAIAARPRRQVEAI